MTTQRTLFIPAALAAAVFALSACDRQDDRTVGQKVDSTIEQVERKTDKAVAEMKESTATARTEMGQAADTAGNKVKDATITSSVNAELARDDRLSAMKIDVDTADGKVALKGTAPDAAARERATELARKVDGVVSVDNQLQVGK